MWTPQNSQEFKVGPDRLIHCSGLLRVLMWWNAYNSKCVLDEIQSCVTYPRHSYRCNQDNESSWLSMKKLMLSNQNSFLIRKRRDESFSLRMIRKFAGESNEKMDMIEFEFLSAQSVLISCHSFNLSLLFGTRAHCLLCYLTLFEVIVPLLIIVTIFRACVVLYSVFVK